MQSSNVTMFPGPLTHPRRNTWPGEDVFGGPIGYGHSSEFDYNNVKGNQGILIGMGAFAHENIRTCCEHGVKKVFNIARHFNLLLPRTCSWLMAVYKRPPTA